MANTCANIDFDMSCDGSGNYQDSGDYLDSVGLPFCCGDVSQQGMSASNCRGLASDLYQQNACGSMGGQTQLSALSSQMVQKRRIPPLGPKATMRRATGRRPLSRASNIRNCLCGMNSRVCNMDLYASCKECCDAPSSDKMRSASGSGKAKVATAVNWLSPLI